MTDSNTTDTGESHDSQTDAQTTTVEAGETIMRRGEHSGAEAGSAKPGHRHELLGTLVAGASILTLLGLIIAAAFGVASLSSISAAWFGIFATAVFAGLAWTYGAKTLAAARNALAKTK